MSIIGPRTGWKKTCKRVCLVSRQPVLPVPSRLPVKTQTRAELYCLVHLDGKLLLAILSQIHIAVVARKAS
ncbi:hypothetical protein PsorP6_017230 [Peronosclerospora sorghi]|uniref:Uncharacterized protein n=1 Tax=Peronosclerospora sorghi TaxID=230839 RepID=A0ACC0WCQ2_9STRA|nr:hypothetical protein PsorP6_017230 [Peronosclerospora sorghi]